MKQLLMASLVLLFASQSFGADGRRASLKTVGLYNLTFPRFTDQATQDTAKSKGDFGGGVLAEFPLSRAIGLEIGGLCQPYKYAIEIAAVDTNLTSTWRYVNFPMTIKIHASSVLSFGLGGYYNIAIGKSKTTGKLLGATVNAESNIADNLKSDYGALATIGFDLPLGKSMSFVLEGRYLWGLKDISGQKFHHVQGIGGFAFFF